MLAVNGQLAHGHTAWALDAHDVGIECPKSGTPIGQYIGRKRSKQTERLNYLCYDVRKRRNKPTQAAQSTRVIDK